jgi:hypothetical protein
MALPVARWPDKVYVMIMRFRLGVFVGFFQLGCFYGPTFSTVQELVPPQIRATLVAFYILLLNRGGVAIGVSSRVQRHYYGSP